MRKERTERAERGDGDWIEAKRAVAEDGGRAECKAVRGKTWSGEERRREEGSRCKLVGSVGVSVHADVEAVGAWKLGSRCGPLRVNLRVSGPRVPGYISDRSYNFL